MTFFEARQMKTSSKMSDLVMESVSQFIARDFHEAYERAVEEAKYETAVFTPAGFDEKIYKKITKLIKKDAQSGKKIARLALIAVLGAACLLCMAFTAVVLLNGAARSSLLSILF